MPSEVAILYGPVQNFQYYQPAQNQYKSQIQFSKKWLTGGLIYNEFPCRDHKAGIFLSTGS